MDNRDILILNHISLSPKTAHLPTEASTEATGQHHDVSQTSSPLLTTKRLEGTFKTD